MPTVLPDLSAAALLDSVTKRGASTTYLALLSDAVDPALVTLANMPEVLTAGYARQPLTWAAPARPTDGEPVTTSTTALVSFGPFTSAMLLDANHLALVTVASGTAGTVQYVWGLDGALTADQNESIQIPVGALAIAEQ